MLGAARLESPVTETPGRPSGPEAWAARRRALAPILWTLAVTFLPLALFGAWSLTTLDPSRRRVATAFVYAGLFLLGAVSFLQLRTCLAQWQKYWRATLAVAFIGLLAVNALRTEHIFEGPREWDFLCFFLDSHVIAERLNLYSPASYQTIAQQLGLEVSDSFRREILEVGFKYPPPSALLFAPLARFSAETGALVWTTAVLLSVGLLAIVLAWYLRRGLGKSPGRERIDTVLMGGALALALPATSPTAFNSQTTFLMTTLVLLTIAWDGSSKSGLAACAATLIKPIAAPPALLLLLRRRYSALAGAIVLGLVLCVASVALLGLDDWASYLKQDYAVTSPAWLYYQANNTSLVAVLGRLLQAEVVPWKSLAVLVPYGLISVLVFLPSLCLAAKSKVDFPSAYCLVLLAGMIVYPGTQVSSGILLCVPIVISLKRLAEAARVEPKVIGVSALALGLAMMSQFTATLLLWGASLVSVGRLARDHES